MTENRSEIDRILDGNKKAFESFIMRYQRLVSHIVFRMTNNKADREDICQEVFLTIHRNLAGFRFESKVSTWVAKVAYNRTLNFLEKKKVPLFDDLYEEGQTLDSVAGDTVRPDEYAETQDISVRLRNEIAQMPVPFRTIITLYHLDEMTYKEIADIMNMPEGTVKSYLFRARKLLKERLVARYGLEEPWQ